MEVSLQVCSTTWDIVTSTCNMQPKIASCNNCVDILHQESTSCKLSTDLLQVAFQMTCCNKPDFNRLVATWWNWQVCCNLLTSYNKPAFLAVHSFAWSYRSLTNFAVLVSHEEVVAQLTQDTLDHGTSLGLNGRRFRPGKFPQLAALKFKV